MKRLVLALAVCYPLLVHAAVVTRNAALTAVCLGWLVLLVLLPPLARGNPIAWAAAAAAGAAVAPDALGARGRSSGMQGQA